MRFARCLACGKMRALVPSGRPGSYMVRTHYQGGAARYQTKMRQKDPAIVSVPNVLCTGSRRVVEDLSRCPQLSIARSEP